MAFDDKNHILFTKMWQPNEEFFNTLTSMGISENASKRALLITGNKSVELAASWIMDNPDPENEMPLTKEEIECFLEEGDDGEEEEDEEEEEEEIEEHKMVFVVNTELGMGVGKISAQVAHATLGLHRELLSQGEKYAETLSLWEEYGAKKIALKGENTEQLQSLEKKAIENNLPCYLVRDAGRTQIAAGSVTVLSIFGPEDEVNKVTGKLKLL